MTDETGTILQPGTTLANRYRIESHIANGGTGAVYKAVDTTLNRVVAVKRFAGVSATAAREAEIAASLTHPNIAAIYDFVQVHNASHLVMEYIEGETLGAILNRRR